MLYDDAIERDAGNLQLTRLLWEHDILTPSNSLIWTSVKHLNREALLCRQGYLTCIEILQVGHLTTKVGQSDKGIYLISQKDRLLFNDTTLRGADLDEQVATSNSGTCGTQLVGVILMLTTLTIT